MEREVFLQDDMTLGKVMMFVLLIKCFKEVVEIICMDHIVYISRITLLITWKDYMWERLPFSICISLNVEVGQSE